MLHKALGSMLKPLTSNLRSIANGPLPANMVATIEEIWDNLKGEKEDNYIY